MAAPRVLAADDDECNLDILRRMLLRLGAEVQTARDGAEAARLALGEAAAGRPFDLVLLDLSMPVLGGAEAARRIKAGLPGAVVLALSGADEEEAALEPGFDGFAQKPITTDLVRGLLGRWCGGGGADS